MTIEERNAFEFAKGDRKKRNGATCQSTPRRLSKEIFTSLSALTLQLQGFLFLTRKNIRTLLRNQT